jgi:3-hydroxyacyl-CoA dehydrogenase
MSQQVRTVAVVGCGVIGMSWACLFLAHGLKVIISDPVEGAEDRFKGYLEAAWPVVQQQVPSAGEEQAKNYEFVADVATRLHMADFIQEVRLCGPLGKPISCTACVIRYCC